MLSTKDFCMIPMIKELAQATVVLITHDNSIAVKADRIIRLQDGKIIYDGDAHDPRAVVQPGEAGEENEEQEVGA